jgi:hypothetical protein
MSFYFFFFFFLPSTGWDIFPPFGKKKEKPWLAPGSLSIYYLEAIHKKAEWVSEWEQTFFFFFSFTYLESAIRWNM